MSAPALPSPTSDRWSSLLLAACSTLALANLPGDDLPPGWLCAFVLPGALLALCARFTPWPWQRALLGVLLQTGACLLALYHAGPMSRPAALACTILPPLGFATVRRHEADQALALFLAFCVLLVGVILDGPHVPLLAAFGVCACLALRRANHQHSLALGRAPRRPVAGRRPRGLLPTVALVAGCLLAALAIERTLAALPSPSTRRSAAAAQPTTSPGPRRVGLDDSFVLDGSRGVLSELTGEQLVRVLDPGGQPLPGNLYLRSGFFSVPGLDRWQTGQLALASSSRDAGHVLHAPRRPSPPRQLELERFAGARNFVFVPPATCEVRGIDRVWLDRPREWIRQQQARDTGPYLVLWEELPLPGRRDQPQTDGPAADLLQLPRDFVPDRWEALLRRWRVGTDAVDAMERIASGLAAHCRYDRLEPSGPWTSAIENFLFHEGDRHGYCMHFASAAALMLRLRGIPCRIGVGLYGGDLDRETPGARIFGSQHAHAWVEVPFADLGFVVFDPTPPAERGQRMPSRLDAGGPRDAEPSPDAEDTTDVLAALGDLLLQPWLLALALGLGFAARLWPHRVHGRTTTAPPPVVRSARRLLARLLQALAAAGHPRARGQTLEALARTLRDQQRLLPAVAAAFDAYQQVRFGGRPFDAERERTLRAGIEAALAMVPPAPAGPREPG